MRKLKTTFLLFILFTILLFPAIPRAALEHYAMDMNLIDVNQVRSLSHDINLLSIYTGATLMSACVFGMSFFVLWLFRNMAMQNKERQYRAW